ncbi:MAG: hypothetical protein K0S04_3639 [Herbinix sp.]|jgi:hypothetical protein|nr:hypothetical protein [Herbinix sp.]
MDTLTKRILSFSIVFIILFLSPQNLLISSAAANATVYEYSPMLEDRGYIYYVQRVESDEYAYDIYRLEVATGNKTRLLSSKNDILDMILHNDTLYYTSYVGEKSVYQTYSLSIDTKENKTICNGYLISLDDSSIYYTVMKGETSKLYKREYGSKKATLIYTGNITFSFVKNLDNTLYFTQFNEATSKLTLYTLKPKETKLAVLTSGKIALDGSERIGPTVSDIIKINGDIYYQYGTFEGSGYYWYGTLIKLASDTNKKSVIAERVYEEKIYHDGSSIFYNEIDSSEKHYKYNTKTGKTSLYPYKTTGTESFNILGDKTYCAKADGKESIIVARFTSGTNKKGLVKPFINISYKQKKNYEYSASVKKYGDYLLIPVTCMDYNDTTYGWRGRYVSVTWYVTDSDGKLLAKFQ